MLAQTLEARAATPGGVAAELPLSAAYKPADNTVDLHLLRRDAGSLTHPVLWVQLPEAAASGGALPRLVGLTPTEREALDELVHDECREMLSSLP